MLGYVNEARNSEYIAEARTGYVAAQTVATRQAASADATTAEDATIESYLENTANIKEITKYIGKDNQVESVTGAEVKDGRVTKLTVTLKNGKTVEFADGEAKMKE